MSGYTGKTTNLPVEVVGMQAQAEREDQWGPMPGTIVSYDASKQTATIRPDFKKKKWDGSDLPLPDLEDVPVDQPRTGAGAITIPIPAGTKVQLTPQMRSMENYDAEGEGSFSDYRSFNLSDMRASIAGGDSASSPLLNVDEDNVHIRFNDEGTFGIKGSPEGKVAIQGAEGDAYDMLTSHVELVAQGFTLLGTEGLLHATQYASIGAQLTTIANKLRAMVL